MAVTMMVATMVVMMVAQVSTLPAERMETREQDSERIT
ncbi:hypothetical protein Hamer_G022418 [Homarus americanus]|uniref:Uncharacterized protein n=1 Tax=Homarus americanus TaxID=6706 RepID=A0A8J5JV80_HOMAM|nr:hypothetical protein Hamer_G022418 [Homarus americanus]